MYDRDGPKERDWPNGRGENRHREQNVSFAGLYISWCWTLNSLDTVEKELIDAAAWKEP
jgi:hypothetical protein